MRRFGVDTSQEKPTIRETLENVIEEALDSKLLWTEICAEFEKLFIIRALIRGRGSVRVAAKLMGLHRNTLSKKLREHAIDRQMLKSDLKRQT